MSTGAGDEWVVSKFGGTSIANASLMRQIIAIVSGPHGHVYAVPDGRVVDAACVAPQPGSARLRKAVVVSAMAGVTNDLELALKLASQRDPSYEDVVEKLVARHECEAKDLFMGNGTMIDSAMESIRTDSKEVQALLRAAWVCKSFNQSMYELVTGYGELWSSLLLVTAMQAQGLHAQRLDSREVLIVRDHEGVPTPLMEVSRQKVQDWLNSGQIFEKAEYVVITGYVASSEQGTTCTLGRNGSDLSATIFAVLLGARAVVIWKDVDGVFSCDPRRVPNAVRLPYLSYEEAMELSYYGSKFLHPRALRPVMDAGTVVWVRSTENPREGTRIVLRGQTHKYDNAMHRSPKVGMGASPDGDAHDAPPIKAFTVMSDICLVNIEGPCFQGMAGVSERVFRSMHDAGINVLLISQASSEQSICLGLPGAQGIAAKERLMSTFQFELEKEDAKIELIADLAIIAAVGDGMQDHVGIAGGFLESMRIADVSVCAIAQGCSERNISVVVEAQDVSRALVCAHSNFIENVGVEAVDVALVTGASDTEKAAARAVVVALRDASPRLLRQHGLRVSVRVEAWESEMRINTSKAVMGATTANQNGETIPFDMHKLQTQVRFSGGHGVVVDMTSRAPSIVNVLDMLAKGVNVISANHTALATGDIHVLAAAVAARKGKSNWKTNSAIVPGLDIVDSLQKILRGGQHKVKDVECVFDDESTAALHAFRRAGGATVDLGSAASRATALARQLGVQITIGSAVTSSSTSPSPDCCVVSHVNLRGDAVEPVRVTLGQPQWIPLQLATAVGSNSGAVVAVRMVNHDASGDEAETLLFTGPKTTLSVAIMDEILSLV